jgi:hypothetical protein
LRDPESRNVEQFQKLLDPGSRLVPRALAGMTNCDTVSKGGAFYLATHLGVSLLHTYGTITHRMHTEFLFLFHALPVPLNLLGGAYCVR